MYWGICEVPMINKWHILKEIVNSDIYRLNIGPILRLTKTISIFAILTWLDGTVHVYLCNFSFCETNVAPSLGAQICVSTFTTRVIFNWAHSVQNERLCPVNMILLLTQNRSPASFYKQNCALQWRHDERDGLSNYRRHYCLRNRLSRRRSKQTSNLRVTGLCEGNSPVTTEFPAQRSSDAENVSIWWRHHGSMHTSISCK